MSDMTQAQVDARIAELLQQERTQPIRWWWVSFASETTGFIGGAIVEARGGITAIAETKRHGINPGGWVEASLIDGDVPDATLRYRLLSESDLQDAGLIE